MSMSETALCIKLTLHLDHYNNPTKPSRSLIHTSRPRVAALTPWFRTAESVRLAKTSSGPAPLVRFAPFFRGVLSRV